MQNDCLRRPYKQLRKEEKQKAKGKGEKERYTQLNAKIQRITRRDKEAFLSEQCKEIEENKKWERLKISSGKLKISREHFMQNGHSKGKKWQGPNRSKRD